MLHLAIMVLIPSVCNVLSCYQDGKCEPMSVFRYLDGWGRREVVNHGELHHITKFMSIIKVHGIGFYLFPNNLSC